jgi:very-short-patch-repair endonuclease
MLIILAIVVAILIVAGAVLNEYSKNVTEPVKFQYKYKSKPYLMTYVENKCYHALVQAVADKYYVFPQVHLSAIIDHKVEGQSWKGAFSHINQKSVDFVLCDRHYLSPKLAIELDDKTHERPDRIDRDSEVVRVLEQAGVPLLRLENKEGFNVVEISKKIKTILENNKEPS